MNANNEKEDRPAALKRRPRPAADEQIDPISYTPAPERQQAEPARTSTSIEPSAAEGPAPAAPAPRVSRPHRRQPTIQLGVRVAVDVSALIDQIGAEKDITARAVVENAVRAYAQQLGTTAE